MDLVEDILLFFEWFYLVLFCFSFRHYFIDSLCISNLNVLTFACMTRNINMFFLLLDFYYCL